LFRCSPFLSCRLPHTCTCLSCRCRCRCRLCRYRLATPASDGRPLCSDSRNPYVHTRRY
ncbi:hypothetical protein J6590_017460, partial [Homalodisca vitripennis]